MTDNDGATAAKVDVLFILAHPDDESFGFGGLMAWAQSQHLRVGLVCATRGEAGEISHPSLGTPATLGAVRERELRCAMGIVGVDPVRLLPYRDSGMQGTPGNDDPRSLARADREAVLADLVSQIRDLQPHAVITFGPDGVYGHPDHVRIGEIATEAVMVAASSADDLIEMSQRETGPFANTPPDVIATMGIPRSEITHVFDVSEFIDTKLRVLASHATQLPYQPEDGGVGDPAMRPRLGRESLKRIPLPWPEDRETADVLDAFNTLPDPA